MQTSEFYTMMGSKALAFVGRACWHGAAPRRVRTRPVESMRSQVTRWGMRGMSVNERAAGTNAPTHGQPQERGVQRKARGRQKIRRNSGGKGQYFEHAADIKDEIEMEMMRLLNQRRYELALALFQKNPAAHALLSAETYYRLLRGANELRQGEETMKVADAMLDVANVEPNRYVFNQVLKGMSMCGRPGEARALLRQMHAKGMGLDAWSFTTCIAAQCNARQMPAAEQLVKDMHAAGIQPTAATYSTLIRGYGRSRNLCKVRETIAEMHTHVASSAEDAFVLSTIVDAFVSCGEHE